MIVWLGGGLRNGNDLIVVRCSDFICRIIDVSDECRIFGLVKCVCVW